MAAYALTIFTGAFLLFQVQPLIGKYILPWFGGGPGVWTTCMLFFQGLLVGGYAYAHLSSRRLKPRIQAALHVLLLLASLCMLPITPSPTWKPLGGENPTIQILGLLAANIGLPYFVLSATGPLMQHWFSRTRPGASPYRLFALSNAGSLLALISFPLFFETHFTRQMQASIWAGGLFLFVVANGYCAFRLWKTNNGPSAVTPPRQPESKSAQPAPPHAPFEPRTFGGRKNQLFFWLLLPACASVLLLATTNKLCQDVAVIPFLWVLPLAVYLLSFIICFDNPRWYLRVPFSLALIVTVGLICRLLFEGTNAPLWRQILTYCAMLFLACMVCHGELYRLKPDPSQLTGFYLAIAVGGALGGFFVAIVAPSIFPNYYELHWGLLGCGILMLLLWMREGWPVAHAGQESSETNGSTALSTPATGRQWIWLASALAVLSFTGIDRLLASIAGGNKGVLSWINAVRVGLWLLLLLWAASWLWRERFADFRRWHAMACAWLFFGVLGLAGALWIEARNSSKESILTTRNFYGVLTVFEYQKNNPHDHYLLLQHGGITHGLQFTQAEQARWATTYYGPGSGIAKAFGALPQGAKRVGIVGLGTGTTAALAQPGDYLRIYEINPAVIRLADSKFTYLSNCPAKVEIALGDARLSMEREPGQQFDLLALDAFSSDAIPVHLLTKEAFELYQRHVKTNGIIAVHVSNHYLDLEPVVVNLAKQFHYQMAVIDYDEEEDGDQWWFYSSTWLLLTQDKALLEQPQISAAAGKIKTRQIPLWTDDFASLYQILSH